MNQEDFDRAFENHTSVDDCYGWDCQYIRNVAATMGLTINLGQAREIWLDWSDKVCAGWLMINEESDEEIKQAITSFINRNL